MSKAFDTSANKIETVSVAANYRLTEVMDKIIEVLPKEKKYSVIKEARNALARAVFFNRLGEIRDRSFEQQRYRASGLNLVTAAVVLWNTVYLERAAHALRGNGHAVDEALLQYLSPLGWEHINLTGDYLWRSSAKVGAGKFRPLRPLQPA